MSKFFVGQKFSSFAEVDSHLKEFENACFVKFSKRDSRRLDSVKEGRVTYHIKKELIYYEIKYVCVKGGRSIVSKSTGKRKTSSSKCACPAHISFRVSRDGKSLEVRSFNDSHNHENLLNLPRSKKRVRNPMINTKSNLNQQIINGVLVEPYQECDEPERTAASQYLFFVTQQQKRETEVNSQEIKKTSETPAIHRIRKDETEVEESPDEPPAANDSFSELIRQQNKILLTMANTMQEKTEESKKQTQLLQQILDKLMEFAQ